MSAPSDADKRAKITRMAADYAKSGQYQHVLTITVEELLALRDSVCLVDVRSAEEQAVSMIPGAISEELFLKQFPSILDDKSTIVAYCTIGFRSGCFSSKLLKEQATVW